MSADRDCKPFGWPQTFRHAMSHELIPEPLRRGLLRFLAATSEERARLIGKLVERNQAMAATLMDLEADDDLRARFEVALLAER